GNTSRVLIVIELLADELDADRHGRKPWIRVGQPERPAVLGHLREDTGLPRVSGAVDGQGRVRGKFPDPGPVEQIARRQSPGRANQILRVTLDPPDASA